MFFEFLEEGEGSVIINVEKFGENDKTMDCGPAIFGAFCEQPGSLAVRVLHLQHRRGRRSVAGAEQFAIEAEHEH